MSKKGSITTSDYLPHEEYERLVECLERDKNYIGAAYCVVSFAFALRVSDIRSLRWCQVLGQSQITVTEIKTKKTKSIPIGPRTQEHIKRLFHQINMKNVQMPIACNQEGKVISVQYLNRWLKKCKDKYNLQIDHFSTHTFRKTFGRYVYNKMNRSQESLILLNRIFRHRDISTTMIYLGIKNDEINSVFEGL